MSKRTASAAGLGSESARSTDELPRGVTVTRGPTGLSLFRASIVQGGVLYELGSFSSLTDAALAYDAGARRIHGSRARLNFPVQGERGAQGTSTLRGISWNPKASRWEVRLKHAGSMLYLGVFDSEKDAALAWDTAALRLRGPHTRINFDWLRESSLLAARSQAAAGGHVGHIRSIGVDQKRARLSALAPAVATVPTCASPTSQPRKAPSGSGARALLRASDDSPNFSQQRRVICSASSQPLFVTAAPDSTQSSTLRTLRCGGFDTLAVLPRVAIAVDVSMTDSNGDDDIAMVSAALSLCSLFDGNK